MHLHHKTADSAKAAKTLHDIMHTPVLSVAPNASLADAHYIMTENHVRRLPVLEDGRLVGIITISDILRAEPANAGGIPAWQMHQALGKITVQQCMTMGPVTAAPETPIAEAARLLAEAKFGALPVVDHSGKVIGIVSESDLFRYLAKTLS